MSNNIIVKQVVEYTSCPSSADLTVFVSRSYNIAKKMIKNDFLNFMSINWFVSQNFACGSILLLENL
jgi:hypothetical protein